MTRELGAALEPPVSLPYLSHSRLHRYLHCPEQYRLYYVERLRPRIPDAALVFGQLMHQALSALFRTGEDPVAHFQSAWLEVKSADLSYGKRESWEGLAFTGRALLATFVRDELPKLQHVTASEKPFSIIVTSLGVPLVGVVDLVAELEGNQTVVDFKTSASAYPDFEAPLSDQLSAYQLAEPETEQAALCVLVKTKDPRIDWHVTKRAPVQIGEYLDKAEFVAGAIVRGEFYKRPGRWCGYCDFLPVCLGDQERAQGTLVQVAAHD